MVAVSLGVLVAFKNWREPSNRLFFYMITAFAVWSFSYWRWLLATNADSALYWVHLLSLGSIFIPIFFFHWVVHLTNNLNRYKLLIWISYIIGLTTLCFSFSPSYVVGVTPKLFFPYWPIPGLLYTIYLFVLYIFLIGTSLVILINKYLNPVSFDQKGQFLYIILGAVIGFGGGLTNFFLWYDIPFPPYGNFLVAAFPFFLGYSIVRHHLFNAKGIATEILVFFISVASLAQTALSTSSIELFLRGLFFTAVVIFGFLIIRSVYGEVEQREKIEKLALELETANERLKVLDKQKSEFVSIASHQLRSPLTAIKGYSSMLLEGSFGKLSGKTKGAVNIIMESSVHLVNIIEDLLNITRIELGGMKYEFGPVDLKKIVQDLLAQLKPNADQKHLALLFSDDGSSQFFVRADQEKIRQVVMNLIDNATKYTEKGWVKVTLGKSSPKTIRLSVADTGIGITKELAGRLFEKFSRGTNSTKYHANSTGLGLYVAKEIVKAHDGQIWVESEGDGKGSVFQLELPTVH